VSTARKTELAERQARLAAVKAQQKKADRRRTLIVWGIVGVIALALIGTTIAVVVSSNNKQAALEEAANAPIKGVKTFSGLSRNHVTGPVDYPQTPPVGGDHDAVWQNCGIYPEPLTNEHAVHSLEHGAVWITYDADKLDDADVDHLRQLADENAYLLVSPYVGLPSPVVASAWGAQLKLDSVDDERLPVFLRAYLQSPDAPEPGAPCTGGNGLPGLR